MKRFIPLVASVITIGTMVSVAGSTPIAAAPIDSKRAEATRLQQQIDANGMRISTLGEQYNGAQLAFEQAGVKIETAQTASRSRSSTHPARRSARPPTRGASLHLSRIEVSA